MEKFLFIVGRTDDGRIKILFNDERMVVTTEVKEAMRSIEIALETASSPTLS